MVEEIHNWTTWRDGVDTKVDDECSARADSGAYEKLEIPRDDQELGENRELVAVEALRVDINTGRVTQDDMKHCTRYGVTLPAQTSSFQWHETPKLKHT